NSYQEYFKGTEFKFVVEPEHCKSNYWLNAIICPDKKCRDLLLKETNELNVMTRPVWKLMHKLPMFKNALKGDLIVSEHMEAHLVNLPSSPINIEFEK
ncbi:MAG: hypothetical protein OQK04_13645, partial [Kangiellaceae bacterium]|nr:hypothetical protein [Kangiellaceae bacterium]